MASCEFEQERTLAASDSRATRTTFTIALELTQ